MRVWPLNQNGLPAASLTPEIFVPLASWPMKGGGSSPLGGTVTVWKPLIFQRTRAPTWIVTRFTKYALLSLPFGTPAALPGGPAVTLRVAPCADAAGTSAVAATAAAAILRVLSKCTPPEIEPVAAVVSTAPMTLTVKS